MVRPCAMAHMHRVSQGDMPQPASCHWACRCTVPVLLVGIMAPEALVLEKLMVSYG